MIRITNRHRSTFWETECKCGCQFEYELDDTSTVTRFVPGCKGVRVRVVCCPQCQNMIAHRVNVAD